jgi:hypothetical protein
MRPPARYWEPETNLPVYNVRTGAFNAEGYGLYTWTTVPEPGMEVRAPVDVPPLRQEFEAVSVLKSPEARAAYVKAYFGTRRPPSTPAAVAAVIRNIDARGAWVTDGIRVHRIVESGMNTDELVPIRGISSGVFVRNLGVLTSYLKSLK